MRGLVAFIPSEFYLILLVGAGLAVIVGAKRLAAVVLFVVLTGTFLPIIAEPLLDRLSPWLLILLLAFFGVGILRALVGLLLGKRATDHAVGVLAADAT